MINNYKSHNTPNSINNKKISFITEFFIFIKEVFKIVPLSWKIKFQFYISQSIYIILYISFFILTWILLVHLLILILNLYYLSNHLLDSLADTLKDNQTTIASQLENQVDEKIETNIRLHLESIEDRIHHRLIMNVNSYSGDPLSRFHQYISSNIHKQLLEQLRISHQLHNGLLNSAENQTTNYLKSSGTFENPTPEEVMNVLQLQSKIGSPISVLITDHTTSIENNITPVTESSVKPDYYYGYAGNPRHNTALKQFIRSLNIVNYIKAVIYVYNPQDWEDWFWIFTTVLFTAGALGIGYFTIVCEEPSNAFKDIVEPTYEEKKQELYEEVEKQIAKYGKADPILYMEFRDYWVPKKPGDPEKIPQYEDCTHLIVSPELYHKLKEHFWPTPPKVKKVRFSRIAKFVAYYKDEPPCLFKEHIVAKQLHLNVDKNCKVQ